MKNPAVTPSRLAALAALGLAASAASAQQLVTVRVLSAQPVVEQVPVQDCGYRGQPSGVGAGVGALTGGLIGSQLGKGSGHIAGAILGAFGGALLGNTAEAYNGGYGRCGTRYSQRVTGYDVTYDYGGRQYQTRTAQPPGQWLQVQAPDAYYGPSGGYSGNGVQSYPVQPAPIATYPVPAYPSAGESDVATAPPAVYGNSYPYYPQQPVYQAPYPSYPQAYAPGYAQPVYQGYPQAFPAAPVYVRPAPRYVSPVGVSLSVGGRIGRHAGVGVGLGF